MKLLSKPIIIASFLRRKVKLSTLPVGILKCGILSGFTLVLRGNTTDVFAPAGDCGTESLFDQKTPVGVHLVETTNL